ncbi:coiled-coil domain-containing protein [Carboxylicivirga sp. RSCT41]|uniref:coiled-coil domain-containing protein n=1 Tax=Carboxylicivirga agarovorans TaxID=3417570 RepID=UPI003D34E2C1
MKKVLSYIMVLFLAINSIGCAEDFSGDIDDLQKQIDELDKELEDLKSQQLADLLAEISTLKSEIAALEADLTDLDGEVLDNYNELMASLQALEDEIANSGSAVYYGDLFTDADFAGFKAAGATIVTGKVAVTKQQHLDDLTAVKMIGNDFSISAGTSINLPYLETIGGNLDIFSMPETGATVVLPVLKSIADNFVINNPIGLESISMPELLVVFKDFKGEGLHTVNSFTMPKLDLVKSIYIDAVESAVRGLSTLDLSATNVVEGVEINGLAEGSTVSLGVVGEDIKLVDNFLSSISFQNTDVYGDLSIDQCKFLSSLSAPNLTNVSGSFSFTWNFGGEGGIGNIARLKRTNSEADVIKAFDKLEKVGREFTFSYNTISLVNGFHALSSVGENNFGEDVGNINIQGNFGVEQMYILNNVTSVNKGILIEGECDAFTGFNTITHHYGRFGSGEPSIRIALSQRRGDDYMPLKLCTIDAFAALTHTNGIYMDLGEVTGFGANTFGSIINPGEEHYLTVYLPSEDDATFGTGNFGACSMSAFLIKVKNGEFDLYANSKAEFYDYNWNSLDYATGVDALLVNCN